MHLCTSLLEQAVDQLWVALHSECLPVTETIIQMLGLYSRGEVKRRGCDSIYCTAIVIDVRKCLILSVHISHWANTINILGYTINTTEL